VSYSFGNDQKLPSQRISIAAYAITAMIAFLMLGFWNLQVLESEYYAQLAERNRIRTMPVMAPRGKMLDREGRTLVDNYPSFSVLLLRDDMDEVASALPEISEGLGIPLEDLEEQVERSKTLPKFQPLILKHEASQADIAFIEARRADLPVLELLMVYRRRYFGEGFMAHVAGYVSEANERDIELGGGRIRPGDVVGKAGLERQYNQTLMGVNGLRRLIVNSVGREVGRLEEKQAISGRPIQLTIDYDLQVVAETALGGRAGAVVALDPRTGEILAMLSHPAPDPNLFAVRVPPEEWRRLNEDPEKPLLNRAIQAQLAPGSVFKIVMTAAMLESKLIPEDFNVFCPGHADFYGRTFRCHVWRTGGHGRVNLHEAIKESCDIFFYNVGRRLGIDRIAYYAHQLGLGSRTGIDLPGEEAGLVPSSEWKRRVFKDRWYPGETISVAIGQGAVTSTPLQIAYNVGGVASGGVFRRPHLLKGTYPVREEHFPLAANTVERITQGMFGVVNEGGTAARVRLEGIEFCGKTGTSQLIGLEALRRLDSATARRFAHNAWFVGFAPRNNPEIVVAVLVQGGEAGSRAAAPVARDVIKAYFDKKTLQDGTQYRVEFRRFEINSAAPRPEGP
jgi:penicillin-binding protein 2